MLTLPPRLKDKKKNSLSSSTYCVKWKYTFITYAKVMLLLGSRDTSMTVVPSTSTSLQAVVLRPVTRQAW